MMVRQLGPASGPAFLLLDNYDSFTWNLAQYLAELGVFVRVVRNDAISVDEIADDASLTAVVISPGPCTPNEAGISLQLLERIAGNVPVLGVCLGHQCIGQMLGGQVVRAAKAVHGKTSNIFHDGKGLFVGVPNPFVATRYHSLVIEPSSLPASLEITAKTWDNEIMGVRQVGDGAPLEGVQFHPESIMTVDGKRMLANFVERAVNYMAAKS
jgi:anthranilate synthase/aminodeoxychorismate synthase-like glutamine amidotransferase